MAMLRFHKSIYTAAAIDKAQEAYDQLLRVSRRLKGAYYEVSLEPKKGDPKRGDPGKEDPTLVREFANYVLYATLRLRRA